ncbi:MAG: DUF484 family protein [Paracoccaceae bacterium]
MSDTASQIDTLRDKIIADPDFILEDRDVMRALIAANATSLGGNIVDLRGIALTRLENRLDRLEDTHRNVIAAAYENLAGTNQVHRAILRMLEPTGFTAFLRDLGGEVADIMRVDSVRLVLETLMVEPDDSLRKLESILVVAKKGDVDRYISNGSTAPPRPVTLRQIQPKTPLIYGDNADWIRSEACLRLDFGPRRLPGMLAFGSEDPHHFKPTQATDLLVFFGAVFERAMRRWLG